MTRHEFRTSTAGALGPRSELGGEFFAVDAASDLSVASKRHDGPLKIVLVLEAAGGGTGRHLLDLSRGLMARGHEVAAIFSPVRAEEGFLQELHALDGLTIFELPMRRSPGPWDIVHARRLSRLLRGIGPADVIHGHSSKAGALVRLARTADSAVVYTPHAFRTMDPQIGAGSRLLFGTAERVLAPLCDRIIAVSAAERAHAEALGIAPERLAVVPNGVARLSFLSRDAARKRLCLRDDELAIGFVGRLCEQKDPLRFVAAVKAARAGDPRIRGVVIGDGPLRMASEAAAGDAVRFLGRCAAAELLSGLDILVMTSHYEAGMPYTIREAIQARLPVISTDVAGISEIMQDQVSGRIVDKDTAPEDFAREIVGLCQDAPKREAWARSAAAAANDSVDSMVERTLSIYRAVLAQRQHAGGPKLRFSASRFGRPAGSLPTDCH